MFAGDEPSLLCSSMEKGRVLRRQRWEDTRSHVKPDLTQTSQNNSVKPASIFNFGTCSLCVSHTNPGQRLVGKWTNPVPLPMPETQSPGEGEEILGNLLQLGEREYCVFPSAAPPNVSHGRQIYHIFPNCSSWISYQFTLLSEVCENTSPNPNECS